MSDNPDLARLSGVDNRKVTMLTGTIVGALCAASGFMLGINNELHSMMGWQVLLPMFAAAILGGGVGRVEGAVLGGLSWARRGAVDLHPAGAVQGGHRLPRCC